MAPYLLAPGVFSERLTALLDDGLAEVVAPTLCDDGDVDPRLAALVLRRYDEACGSAVGEGLSPLAAAR